MKKIDEFITSTAEDNISPLKNIDVFYCTNKTVIYYLNYFL